MNINTSLVSPDWLEQNLDNPNIFLIEIAGLGQEDMNLYKQGHIKGAYCFDWKNLLWHENDREFPSPSLFSERLGSIGISNDTTVVFYGEPIQFGIYAWWVFRYCGHENVKILDGGRSLWQTKNKKMTTVSPDLRPKKPYLSNSRNTGMRISRDEVFKSIYIENKMILDGRSLPEYKGERVGAPGNPDTGALRYGRIPGAKHLLYEDLLNTDKSFKSSGQIMESLQSLGFKFGNDIITYCRMSHRATVLYFALTEILKYNNVKVYDGSWTEWGNLVGVPIEK